MVRTIYKLCQAGEEPSREAPCIDPIFGPTASSIYWSASAFAGNPDNAWDANFDTGSVRNFFGKTFDSYVRAVRAGSCN